MPIKSQGKFTAIGMRQKVEDLTALVINTCAANDTDGAGDLTHWVWSNPTNRRFEAVHSQDPSCRAVSTEALWQGTKMKKGQTEPDRLTLQGDWRRGKGKRPVGAWAGPNRPLITTPGEARRVIYLPAFRNQVVRWNEESEDVRSMINAAYKHDGPVFLRDFDTGRGVDRNGPMSHAWVLACWLNAGSWDGDPA